VKVTPSSSAVVIDGIADNEITTASQSTLWKKVQQSIYMRNGSKNFKVRLMAVTRPSDGSGKTKQWQQRDKAMAVARLAAARPSNGSGKI